jgi:hypothetical protein
MVTTQAIKGGFELNLGRGQGGQVKVDTRQVDALLKQMRTSPGYDKAKSKFEFRLQERDGRTYLQLKERNLAGRFKGMLGLSNASQERRAALNLLQQHYGLPAAPRAEGQHVNTEQALSFQRGHEAQWSKTAEDMSNIFGYQVLPARQEGDVRAMLGRCHEDLTASGRAAPGQSEAGPLAPMFDRGVLNSLARSKLQVDGDRLTLSSDGPSDGLSVGQRLEAIVGFVEKHTGAMRTAEPEQFQRVLDRLMRNESFKFSGDLTRQIADHGLQERGLATSAFLQSRVTEFQFDRDGFRVTQSAGGSVEMGGLEPDEGGAIAGRLATASGVSASQTFSLSLQDLSQDDFDVARAAKNLQVRDHLIVDFERHEAAEPSPPPLPSSRPDAPAPVYNPFED